LPDRKWTLPNTITVARVATCPIITLLALNEGAGLRLTAFVLFVLAALSDLWDGYLARKHGWITEIGKLLDPIADKVLLIATLLPIYIISHRGDALAPLPWWGPLSGWVVGIIIGRELLVTALRGVAVRRGFVLSAGQSGKYKAFLQNLFLGAALLWYPLVQLGAARGWSGGFWVLWQGFHGVFLGTALLVALGLTVFSLFDYLWSWRHLRRKALGH
jgi:CDP-diacylglycerol--glycerol-3-phosphate 3-phosphatidyltransferase